MKYGYAFQRTGTRLVSWKNGPPNQTRAADAKSLGSLGGDTLDAMPLPRPGAPEPLPGLDGLGCSGCGRSGSVPESVVAIGIAAVLLYAMWGKRS